MPKVGACRLLTADEAGEIYGFKPAYLKNLARQGQLAYVKFDKFVRFDPADIEAWIDTRRRGPRAS
jgi:hypothetical protein